MVDRYGVKSCWTPLYTANTSCLHIRRRVRMVAQRPALFPHLSVLGNISYGELSRHECDR